MNTSKCNKGLTKKDKRLKAGLPWILLVTHYLCRSNCKGHHTDCKPTNSGRTNMSCDWVVSVYDYWSVLLTKTVFNPVLLMILVFFISWQETADDWPAIPVVIHTTHAVIKQHSLENSLIIQLSSMKPRCYFLCAIVLQPHLCHPNTSSKQKNLTYRITLEIQVSVFDFDKSLEKCWTECYAQMNCTVNKPKVSLSTCQLATAVFCFQWQSCSMSHSYQTSTS